MSYELRKLSTRTRLTAGALALIIVGASHAQTLVGGGATLPSVGYVGAAAITPQDLQVWGTSTSNLGGAFVPDYIDPNSLFGVYQAQSGYPQVSYCLTGDDVGKNILAGIASYNVQYGCTANSSGQYGFGAPVVNRTDLIQPNFVAADSPLSANDYINYQNNHPSGDYPVQFPALAGAIAIAFNLVDNIGVQVSSSEVNFTDQQLCEIFSGKITSWSDLRLASAFTLPPGHVIPSNPINVQYHSDGSGTTFGLSNHLAYVCHNYITSPVFETNQAFTSVVANFFTTNGVETLPSNWTGSSGDASLAWAIGNAPNSIGYVSAANALATNPQLSVADVNGTSPITNFGSPLTVPGTAVVYNEVISSTNMNGFPTMGTISAITGATNPPATQCIALVKPALYGRPGLPGGILPTGTYPIVAISYLLGNTNGNGTDLVNAQNLLAFPYTVTQSSVSTIGPGTGLAFLNPNTNAFTASQVKDCLVN